VEEDEDDDVEAVEDVMDEEESGGEGEAFGGIGC